MNYRPWMLSIFILCAACTGMSDTSGVLQVTNEPAQAEDCRKPKIIYDAFQIHARELTWKGSQLTAVFEVRNITKAPKSTRNGSGNEPDTVSGLLTQEIVSADGVKYAPSVASLAVGGALDGNGSPLINPGMTAQGRIVFDAPRGAYTFKLTRIRANLPREFAPEVWMCLVPAI
jgi:hypothetical protein